MILNLILFNYAIHITSLCLLPDCRIWTILLIMMTQLQHIDYWEFLVFHIYSKNRNSLFVQLDGEVDLLPRMRGI